MVFGSSSIKYVWIRFSSRSLSGVCQSFHRVFCRRYAEHAIDATVSCIVTVNSRNKASLRLSEMSRFYAIFAEINVEVTFCGKWPIRTCPRMKRMFGASSFPLNFMLVYTIPNTVKHFMHQPIEHLSFIFWATLKKYSTIYTIEPLFTRQCYFGIGWLVGRCKNRK